MPLPRPFRLAAAAAAAAVIAAAVVVHAAPPTVAECELAVQHVGQQAARITGLQSQLKTERVATTAATAEAARLAAELEAARRKVEALAAQIKLAELLRQNDELRAQLQHHGDDAAVVDQWLCEHGSEPHTRQPCRSAEPATCDTVRYVAASGCDGGAGRRATLAELTRCKVEACDALPQWGIAHGDGATMHGKGYKCLVEAGTGADGAAESICIASGLPAGDAAPMSSDVIDLVRSGTAVPLPVAGGSAKTATAAPAPAPPPAALEPETAKRRATVVRMMQRAWDGYADAAWGENELRPVSKKGVAGGIFGNTQMGSTIVDALDTLILMGLHDRASDARRWIELQLDFDVDEPVSVFEVTIRYVGGLLGAWALTGDSLYPRTAVKLAERLLPAFDTPTGVPRSTINLRSGKTENWGWQPAGKKAILSELGGIQLEFTYLSEVSGDPRFQEAAQKAVAYVTEKAQPGLPKNFINTETGQWGNSDVSVGAFGDSYYEYLLKVWLLKGGSRLSDPDPAARARFDATAAEIRTRLHRRTADSNLLYIADDLGGSLKHQMYHLACFAGGLYALGSMTAAAPADAEHYLRDAADITATCHEGYAVAPAGLGPEKMEFSGGSTLSPPAGKYILRPETIESYFYMWRATHDPKYREWAWEALQAIERHCATGSGGYSGIENVNSASPKKDDIQQSFFLAETLKYLYLIFSPDDVLPLSSWVFNTEAHPFPIAGRPRAPSPHATSR